MLDFIAAFLVFMTPAVQTIDQDAASKDDRRPIALRSGRGGYEEPIACPACYVSTLPPRLAPIRGAKRQGRLLWKNATRPYTYIDETLCRRIVVPVEFVTDFASVPNAARVTFNPADYAEAALVHDWLYAIGEEGMRADADLVFRNILREVSSRPDAAILYRAVRMFGNDGYGLESDYAFHGDFRGFYTPDDKPETGFLPLSAAEEAEYCASDDDDPR